MITRNNIGARAVEKKDLETLKDWRNIPNFRKNFREVCELNNDNQEKQIIKNGFGKGIVTVQNLFSLNSSFTK